MYNLPEGRILSLEQASDAVAQGLERGIITKADGADMRNSAIFQRFSKPKAGRHLNLTFTVQRSNNRRSFR